jgi:NAD(P)-dependent dehydrogenase (short-subunit alcohol dehydrogenase family)
VISLTLITHILFNAASFEVGLFASSTATIAICVGILFVPPHFTEFIMHRKRSILISGCSSGIGAATAAYFKDEGWTVYATARAEEDVSDLLHKGYIAWALDVRCSESIDSTIQRMDEIGICDVFFANAGFAIPGAIEDLSRSAWQDQFETNVFGTAESVSKISKEMVKRGTGTIIINSSTLGYISAPLRGAYVSSKYAVEGLADTLRLELTGTGVHVCLVEPGPIVAKFRENSLKKMIEHTRIQDSRHLRQYHSMIQRLKIIGPAVPFTKTSTDVAKTVFRIATSRRPKFRYRVTMIAKVNWWLKILLPSWLLDIFIVMNSD